MPRPRLALFALAPVLTFTACASLLGDFTAGSDTTDGDAGNDGPVTSEGGGGDTSTTDVKGGDTSTTDGPTALPHLNDAVTVATGRSHTCIVNAAQEVLCWGSNGAGQLGVPIAQVPRTSFPVKVDIGGKAVAIAAGGQHTCAILVDDTIKCWGANDRGQLGRGTLVPTGGVDLVSRPTANPSFFVKPELIVAGASFTCAGMSQGNVNGLPDRRFYCWGENIDRQSGTESTNGQPVLLPSLITLSGNDNPSPGFEGWGIATGDSFACGGLYVAAGAAVFSAVGCWGSRTVGQIGAPPIAGFEVNPSKYPIDSAGKQIFGLFKTGLLATGASHGCARIDQGGVSPALTCWGNNTRGQTGSATSGARPAESIAGFDATSVTVLAAGGQNTCVIVDSAVQCIGANEVGQLGRGTLDMSANKTFANVLLPPSASALSVGATHACAVLGTAAGRKGEVACWGQNQNGQLGDGFDIDLGYPGEPDPLKRLRATPVRVVIPK